MVTRLRWLRSIADYRGLGRLVKILKILYKEIDRICIGKNMIHVFIIHYIKYLLKYDTSDIVKYCFEKKKSCELVQIETIFGNLLNSSIEALI